MKQCINCKLEKNFSEFYKHPETSDGYLGRCKSCQKELSRSHYDVKSKNKEWIESERERAREKYLRLGYKERQEEWDSKKPWKNYPEYKNLNKKLGIPSGFELHHWSYKRCNIESVFVLPVLAHRRCHKYLTLDFRRRCFKLEDGTLLDTREKHENFLKSKNFI